MVKKWFTPNLEDVPTLLGDEIEFAVEKWSSLGAVKPDWVSVVDEIEQNVDGLDLGNSMDTPVVKAVLKEAQRVYRELREDNE